MLHKLLCHAITDQYSQHRVKPGIQTSWLGDKWYVAIHIYPLDVPSKVVICSAKDENLQIAYKKLAREWLDKIDHPKSVKKLEEYV